MATSPRRAVIVAGLGRFQHFDTSAATAAIRATAPKDIIVKETARAEAAGFDLVILEINPDDPAWSLQQTTDLLRSRHFDGLSIGFGIRGNAQWTALFEDLVNAARELSPETKLGFSSSPMDICGTIKRLFPDAAL